MHASLNFILLILNLQRDLKEFFDIRKNIVQINVLTDLCLFRNKTFSYFFYPERIPSLEEAALLTTIKDTFFFFFSFDLHNDYIVVVTEDI